MTKKMKRDAAKAVEEKLLSQYTTYLHDFWEDREKRLGAWRCFLETMIEKCNEKLEILNNDTSGTNTNESEVGGGEGHRR